MSKLGQVRGRGPGMSDFCISRPMMDRVLQQAELMDRMMECVGVEPVRAARLDNGTAWYVARSRCIACPHDRRCGAWIAEQVTKPCEPPGYCANVAFFHRARKRPSDASGGSP